MKMEIVNLSAEAAAEARRLAGARMFAVDGDEDALAQLEGDGTWIAAARRHRIRTTLGLRLLLVWRLAFEDAGGAMVESRLVPMVVELSHAACGRQRREWIESIVQQRQPHIQSSLDAAGRGWRIRVESVSRSFMSARAARERAIAAAAGAGGAHAFQPGLFDRRAERAQALFAAAAVETESAAADRRAALARSSAIEPRPPQLLLVLAP